NTYLGKCLSPDLYAWVVLRLIVRKTGANLLENGPQQVFAISGVVNLTNEGSHGEAGKEIKESLVDGEHHG
ncbi:MAG TPA: hypothetical protein VMT71_03620, partial [Syntrophorhabdales bacterium]|nr:hypothetical protein [Syntrophorhabdales bacterium]